MNERESSELLKQLHLKDLEIKDYATRLNKAQSANKELMQEITNQSANHSDNMIITIVYAFFMSMSYVYFQPYMSVAIDYLIEMKNNIFSASFKMITSV